MAGKPFTGKAGPFYVPCMVEFKNGVPQSVSPTAEFYGGARGIDQNTTPTAPPDVSLVWPSDGPKRGS